MRLQQTSDTKYPETLLIAINKYGVNLIDPHSKVCFAVVFGIFSKVFHFPFLLQILFHVVDDTYPMLTHLQLNVQIIFKLLR